MNADTSNSWLYLGPRQKSSDYTTPHLLKGNFSNATALSVGPDGEHFLPIWMFLAMLHTSSAVR